MKLLAARWLLCVAALAASATRPIISASAGALVWLGWLASSSSSSGEPTDLDAHKHT